MRKIKPSKTELVLNEMIKESDKQHKRLIEKLDSVNAKLDDVISKLEKIDYAVVSAKNPIATDVVYNKDTKQIERIEYENKEESE